MNKVIDKKFLSGTLNTLILALLKENGKMYGYEICVKVKEISDNAIQLTEGAIYPALHKMEKKGLITSTKEIVNGRTRKYYAIVLSESVVIDDMVSSLFDFTNLLQKFLKPTT
jgi:DNA-binding PadR family transcriptional regulator